MVLVHQELHLDNATKGFEAYEGGVFSFLNRRPLRRSLYRDDGVQRCGNNISPCRRVALWERCKLTHWSNVWSIVRANV